MIWNSFKDTIDAQMKPACSISIQYFFVRFLAKRGQMYKSRFKSGFLFRSGKDPTQIDAGFRFEIEVANSVCLIYDKC